MQQVPGREIEEEKAGAGVGERVAGFVPSVHRAPLRREFAAPHADILIGIGSDHSARLTVDAEAILLNPDWLDITIADLTALKVAAGNMRLGEVPEGAIVAPRELLEETVQELIDVATANRASELT